MKKAFVILLTLSTLFFAGCASDDNSENTKNTKNTVTTYSEGWYKYAWNNDDSDIIYVYIDDHETIVRAGTETSEYNIKNFFVTKAVWSTFVKITDLSQLPAWAIKSSDNSKDDNKSDTTDEASDNSKDESSSEKTLDIYTKNSFSMKIGETVTLKASWSDGDNCTYSISENEYNAISLLNNVITAKTVGTAVVKMTSNTNTSYSRYCTITVTADGFSGNGIEYLMIGTWYNGQSYIKFNSDKTGYMKVYLGGAVVQDASFNWSASTGSIKLLTISGSSSSYINKQYTITSINSRTLNLKGYLAFGLPQESSWTKQ